MGASIHLYFQSDQSILLQFFEAHQVVNTAVVSSPDPQELLTCLQRHVCAGTKLAVFLTDAALVTVETMVPRTLSDEEVLQYISFDQARLLPMLEEKIYVDMVRLSIDDDRQRVAIMACNARPYGFLAALCRTLKLNWCYLGAANVRLRYNLLPWRQSAAVARQQKFWIVVILTITSLVVLLFFIRMALSPLVRQDRALERTYQAVLARVRPPLIALEALNGDYQQMAQQARRAQKIWQHQEFLLQALQVLEPEPLENIQLHKLAYTKNIFNIAGKAQNLTQLIHYLHRLRHHFSTTLRWMRTTTTEKNFPVQFALEVAMK